MKLQMHAPRLLQPILVLLALCLATATPAQAAGASSAEPTPTLRVVALFPMTGPGASLGAFLEQGATLAREKLEQESAGKLKIDLEIVDSKGRASEAVTALQAAIARSRPQVIISTLSPVSRAIRPVVEQEGILTLVTMTTMQDIARGTRHMVRVYSTASDFAVPLADYSATRFGKVHVLQMQDEFGQSLQEAFSTRLAGSRTAVTTGTFEMLQKDTRPLVAGVLDAKPDAVYVIGYGPAYLSCIRFLRELAPDVPLMADSTFSDPATQAALGPLAEGVVFTGTENELADTRLPSAAAFRAAFQARHGRLPWSPAVFAYDTVRLAAGVSVRKSRVVAPTKKDVIARSPVKGVLGPVTIDAEGESRFPMKLMRVVQGTNVAIP